MTTFAKTQALYQFLFPQASPVAEGVMAEQIVEHYQTLGFAILDIEDVFATIAHYDFEPITTLEQARKRLYRQLVGYGLLAQAKMNNTPIEEQEAQILADYARQGVNVTTFADLLTHFPWSVALGLEQAGNQEAAPVTHKLF